MTTFTGIVTKQTLRLLQNLRKDSLSANSLQRKVLVTLLEKAKNTAFGTHYKFENILREENPIKAFKQQVPVHTYSTMHEQWWQRCRAGEKNVCWPGRVKYFALSSGTSDSSSKHIPVTTDMLRSMKKTGLLQIGSLTHLPLSPAIFQKKVLMLGGTTSLTRVNGYFEGDMSGISTINMPLWLSSFYFKPGQKIAKQPNWQDRIDLIVQNAKKWDIGIICGIPSWVQIVLEKIISYHRVRHIHEVWPNLSVYIHGGVSFEHYRDNFGKLLGKPITCLETYMASEGSFGFMTAPEREGIKLVTGAGIFYEFIPFTAEYFDEEGNLKPQHPSFTLEEVEQNINYAVVISTCAGAWRYLIGDVVRFVNVKEQEVIIAGRTSQFLNLCGEHVSMDNLTQAIKFAAQSLGVQIGEFAVAGIKHDTLFAYRWFIGCDDRTCNANQLKKALDTFLQELNDDYRVERAAAIKEIFVDVLPNQVFHSFLKSMNKEGGMHKFPRVLKNGILKRWEDFLKKEALTFSSPSFPIPEGTAAFPRKKTEKDLRL